MNGLVVPDRKPYVVSNENKAILQYVDGCSSRGEIVNVMVKGLSGCGKSDLVSQYAATRNRGIAVLEIGRLSESGQIFGSMVAQDGSTYYSPGLFTKAIQTPGSVIHLQEFNRPENDKALNAIFSVLDETYRSVWLDEVGLVTVAPGVTFFATLNEGYQFIGTMPVDEALDNRFAVHMSLGYLPAVTENQVLCMRTGIEQIPAGKLVTLANALRGNSQDPVHVSTRQLIEIAKMTHHGLSIFHAFKASLGSDESKLEGIMMNLHLQGRDAGEIGEDRRYGLL